MAIFTGECIVMFPSLFESTPKKPKKPRADGKKGWGCVLLFKGAFPQGGAPRGLTPEATATYVNEVNTIKGAAWSVVVEKFGDHAKAVEAFMRPGRKWNWCLKDGVEHDGVYAGFEPGDMFINCSSSNPVGVVDKFKDPATGKARIITNPAEIYAGCKVRAQITFAWFSNESDGVTCYIENLQKLGDGPRLDGRVAAADAFGAEDPVAAEMPGQGASAAVGALPF